MQQISDGRPIPGVMFGLTHNTDMTPRLREAKVLKVGIGMPKGKAINAWKHSDSEWRIRVGYKEKEAVTRTIKGGPKEAEEAYWKLLPEAPMCNFPRKQPFFNFTREVFQSDGSVLFAPDFQATAAQKPMPTEIDIVFLSNNPWSENNGYQMWTRTQCACRGDGINALRLVELAKEHEMGLAEESRAAGQRYFPIIGGCWTSGQCEYSKPTIVNGREQASLCKASADLKFQLAHSLRIGGTAYFHTSGRKSIEQIYTSVEIAKGLTGGRLAGLTFKMLVKPYFVNHAGQPSKQYGVSIEFRAEDIEDVEKNMLAQAWKFANPFGATSKPLQTLAPPPMPQLQSIPDPEEQISDEDDDQPLASAAAIADEFYPEQSGDYDEEPPTQQEQPQIATATKAKTEALKEKLAKEKDKKRETAAGLEPLEYRQGLPVYAGMPPMEVMADKAKFWVGDKRYYYDAFDQAYRPAPDVLIHKPEEVAAKAGDSF